MAKKEVKEIPIEITKAEVQGGRILSKTAEVFSDLYKLEVAPVIKNVGTAEKYEDDPSSFVEFEHTHPFRTRDSDGKFLSRSSSIGGHHHVLELEPNPKGSDHPPVVKSCSPPMKLVRKKIKGQWQVVDEPANDYDDHTHEVTYIRSDKTQARVQNIEAQKVIAFIGAKGSAVAGVVEK